MATTTAKTKKEVDEMSAKDRLYDSLSYSYGKKAERLEKEYNKAYSQADRQALSRGMQRTSWNNQTLANINEQKINALNDNESALIADYEKGISDLENQEKEDERWEKQFAEGQRQYNESLAYQKERAAASDAQWNQQFQYQQGRDTVADTQWQKQYDEQLRQFNEQMAYNREENAANRAFTTAEREAQQAYNTQERLAQQEWQAGQNQANRDAELALQKLNQAFQANENALSRQAQKDLQILQQEFTAKQNRESQAWQSNENRLSREATEALQRLSQEFSAGENAKNRDAQLALQQLSNAFTAEQNALNRAESRYQYDTNLQYQKSRDQISDNRYEKELAYQKERDQISDARYADELAYNRAFQEKQWDEQVSQWNAEFGYNKMSNEQKIAYNYLTAALQLGADVSDELLEKAGLTREDYNSMLKQSQAMLEGTTTGTTSSSSGGRSSGTSNSGVAVDGYSSAATRDEAVALGFKNATDYYNAMNHGFENGDDFYAAKKLGFSTMKEYAEYLANNDEEPAAAAPAAETPAAEEKTVMEQMIAGLTSGVSNADKVDVSGSKPIDPYSAPAANLTNTFSYTNGKLNTNQNLAFTNRDTKLVVGEGKGVTSQAQQKQAEINDKQRQLDQLRAQRKKATTASVQEDLDAKIAELESWLRKNG